MLTWLKWPNTITLLEAFRINDAKIESVEAVFTYVPYFMHNPWNGKASSPPADPTLGRALWLGRIDENAQYSARCSRA